MSVCIVDLTYFKWKQTNFVQSNEDYKLEKSFSTLQIDRIYTTQQCRQNVYYTAVKPRICCRNELVPPTLSILRTNFHSSLPDLKIKIPYLTSSDWYTIKPANKLLQSSATFTLSSPRLRQLQWMRSHYTAVFLDFVICNPYPTWKKKAQSS